MKLNIRKYCNPCGTAWFWVWRALFCTNWRSAIGIIP